MKRIQRRRTKGWRMPENTVYVGRPSKWGNGYRVGDFDPDPNHATERMTAETALGYFEWVVAISPNAEKWAEPLRGKDLACWCELCSEHADGLPLEVICDECAPCHADVVLEVANP